MSAVDRESALPEGTRGESRLTGGSGETFWGARGWWALAIAAAVAAVFVRLFALGRAALAEDEYYLITSVGYILERGIPSFPGGGYYPRGLLLQYLTAPIFWLTGAAEWSVRIVPALASLAAIPALVLMGRRLGGPPVAAVAVALFGLSLWEVEFARFGRMYTPFQTLFLWQTVLLLRVSLDGAKGLWKWMPGLALAGILVYDGAVFLWVLAAIPLLRGDLRASAGRVGAAGAVLAALFLWERTDFRGMGQPPRLPPGIGIETAASGTGLVGPVVTPALGVERLLEGPFWAAALLLALAAIGGWILVRGWRSRQEPLALAFRGLVLLLALLGLFGAALFLVLGTWLLRPELLRTDGAREGTTALVGVGVAALLVWSLFHLTSGLAPYGVAKELLNYPPLNQPVLQPWLGAMPRMTVALLLLLATRLALELLAERRSDVWRFLAGVPLVCVLAVAVIATNQQSSRYTFFLYASVLLLAAEAIWTLVGVVLRAGRVRAIGTVAALVAFMWVSDDYSASRLARIHTPDVAYGIGMTPARWGHFVPRDDHRAPAEVVNAGLEVGDIVIFGPPASAYYLEQVDFAYELHPSIRFFDISTAGGTRELWTGAGLLWRQEDLLAVLCEAEADIWLVLHADPRGIRSERDAAVRERLAAWEVFSNIGGSAKSYRVPSDEWRARGECVPGLS